MRIAHLRVKICSLAAEQKIIRREEWRAKRRRKYREADPDARSLFWSLRDHRMGLRNTLRESLLAYACMRGRSYAIVERESDFAPFWDRVREAAIRFGVEAAHIDEWIVSGKAHWNEQKKRRMTREREKTATAA